MNDGMLCVNTMCGSVYTVSRYYVNNVLTMYSVHNVSTVYENYVSSIWAMCEHCLNPEQYVNNVSNVITPQCSTMYKQCLCAKKYLLTPPV